MRIGLYVELAKDEKPSGIGIHVRELVGALAALDADNEYLLYYQTDLLGRARPFAHQPAAANFRPRPVRFPAGWQWNRPRLWWDVYLPRVLRRDRVDLFHGPNHFVPAIDRDRNVLTIHDLAYFRMAVYDHDEAARVWTCKSLERSGAVIALSENTRRDIEGLGVEPERVRVIYGGGNVVPEAKIQHARAAELRQRLRLPEHYVLFVGTLQPRKNVPFLLRAFAQMKKAGGLPHGLVLAGHRDAAAAEIDALINDLGLASDVIVTGYVADWELPLLYKMADLFVLPTLYEGFTLVTLEAMAYGTPVISTDTSSIREGVGDAAVLVPVNDDGALASAMRRVLTDETVRRQLVERGRAQARKFTWEQNARETLDLYRRLYQARTQTTQPRGFQPAGLTRS